MNHRVCDRYRSCWCTRSPEDEARCHRCAPAADDGTPIVMTNEQQHRSEPLWSSYPRACVIVISEVTETRRWLARRTLSGAYRCFDLVSLSLANYVIFTTAAWWPHSLPFSCTPLHRLGTNALHGKNSLNILIMKSTSPMIQVWPATVCGGIDTRVVSMESFFHCRPGRMTFTGFVTLPLVDRKPVPRLYMHYIHFS